ncbi:MAG: hypothetical protein ABEI99_00925, partial [Halobaculum sp.]
LSPETVEAGGVAAEAVEAQRVEADAVAAGQVNGTAYAARFPGEDLSVKVRNAIEELPAGGTVVVTPRPDGEPWTWSETVRVNLRETGAVELLVRGQTMIEYTGDGWTLETTYRPAQYGQLVQGAFLTLRGGNWRATGDPDGWLRMVDTNFCEIAPQRVIDYTNSDRTGTGIRVEIQEIFAESNVFTGHFANVDIGMDFVPSDTPGVAGGEAAASFQGNYVRNVKVLNAGRYGFRWRDGAQCQATTVQNTDSFARASGDSAEFVHYYLGGDFDGGVFVGPKTEDANPEGTDMIDTAFALPDALGTPPIVIAPEIGNGIDQSVRRDDRFKTLPTLQVWDDGRRQRAGVHDLDRRDEEGQFAHGGVYFPPQQFGGPLAPRQDGRVVYNDGSDGNPRGLYRAEPDNSRWVKVSDNSVTVSD